MSHTRNNSVDSVDASRKTRYRPNKDKRGVKATKFPFNVEQEKILNNYGMDLEENISESRHSSKSSSEEQLFRYIVEEENRHRNS